MPAVKNIQTFWSRISSLTAKWNWGYWYDWFIDTLVWLLLNAWSVILWVYEYASDIIVWVVTEFVGLVNSIIADLNAAWAYITGYIQGYLNWAANSIYTIISWVQTDIWPRISSLFSQVANLWNYISATIVTHINTVTNSLTSLWSWTQAKVNEIFAGIASVWSSIEYWVNKLFEEIDFAWLQITSWAEGEFNSVYSYVLEVYNSLASEINHQASSLTGEVNRVIGLVYGYIDARVTELRVSITGKINKIVVNIEHLFTFLEDAFDDSLTLSKNLVHTTTAKYGTEVLKVVFNALGGVDIDKDRQRVASVDTKDGLAKDLENIKLGLDGPWADVEKSLNENSTACQEDRNPVDVPIDQNLLPSSEREELKKTLDTLDQWMGG